MLKPSTFSRHPILLALAVHFLAAVPAPAQQSADTAKTSAVVLVDPGIALGRSTIVLPPSFRPEDQFMILSPLPRFDPAFMDWSPRPKADLLSPYLLGLRREQELSTLYSILGAVELGAVAYVAYRHIRKYGF